MERMSLEKTPVDGLIRPIPSSLATSEVNPACTAPNRKKSEMGGSTGRTLSMREFFEAGGRAYEVYLSYQDRQSLSDSHVLPTHCPLSLPTKDNRKQLSVDQHPPQIPEVGARAIGNGGASNNTSVLTVVHMTATCGSPTSPRPGYAQAPTGQRSQRLKDSGASRCYVAADVIDQVIASRLTEDSDAFGRKEETERRSRNVITPLFTTPGTMITNPPIASSSPNEVSPVSTTSPALPAQSPCTSPMENFDSRPSNAVHLRDSCPKRKLTDEEDPELVVDLSYKRRKNADNDQCEAVNQPNVWPKEATSIDRNKGAKIEADDKTITRPGIAGTVPKVVNQSATIFSDVKLWSVDQVVRFVANVQGCREYAEIFRQEEIDGACLIRLSESHLLNVIRMKLGPALRLRQAIATLCSLDAV